MSTTSSNSRLWRLPPMRSSVWPSPTIVPGPRTTNRPPFGIRTSHERRHMVRPLSSRTRLAANAATTRRSNGRAVAKLAAAPKNGEPATKARCLAVAWRHSVDAISSLYPVDAASFASLASSSGEPFGMLDVAGAATPCTAIESSTDGKRSSWRSSALIPSMVHSCGALRIASRARFTNTTCRSLVGSAAPNARRSATCEARRNRVLDGSCHFEPSCRVCAPSTTTRMSSPARTPARTRWR
mmetsp:Transcript_914/g.2488  ORF Transcript_914/g.2488 Transcript_914/m.2488 type:complete len:241 (-) Transcript_914:719-1441(-)